MKLFSLILLSLCTQISFAATLINGAGATFPFPLYSKWFSEYQKINSEVQINYQSIGSGGGIRQFSDKTVDFGASDAPMTDEQMQKAGAPVVHIPTVLGAVVAVYNISGVQSGLKLTPEALSAIFLGEIKKWEDPRLTKLNPELKLTGDIIVVHRSDGSGTSAVFTDYLSKVSPAWKEKVGQGTAVNWPVGLGGKGNEGVAGLVKQTPGSIGYVEFVYAEFNNLSYANLKNKTGKFVTPSLASVTSAATASIKAMPEDFRISITNAEGPGAYPLSSFTYLLVWRDTPDAEKGGQLVKFLNWAIKDGQKLASELKYSPLPKSLVAKIEAKIKTLTFGKQKG